MNDKHINDGGPAFPQGKGVGEAWVSEGGMTLRDYFAAKAMQGLAANPKGWDMTDEMVAKWAYNAADAMLKERNR